MSVFPRRSADISTILLTTLCLLSTARGQDDDGDETIVVEEQRREQTETSASATVIEVDERLPESADVQTVVGSAAGAHVTSFGGLGDFSAVSLRGSSTRQVQVYLDGIPINPDGSATVNLAELPLHAFERVEIYRGAGPPRLAASPVGGIVNLVTPDSTEVRSIGASAGSFQTGRLDLAFAEGNDTADGFAFAELLSSRGNFVFFDDNGTSYDLLDDSFRQRQNNDKTQLSTHARGRLRLGRTEITLLDALSARDEGIPGNALYVTESARLETLRNLAVLSLSHKAAPLSITGRTWLLQRSETFDDRLGEAGLGSVWQTTRWTTTGALGHASWALEPWISLGLSANARVERARVTDEETGQRAAPNQRLGGSAALSGEVFVPGGLEIAPVVQLTWLDNRALGQVPFSGAAVAPDGKATSISLDPRLALAWSLSETVTLSAHLGRYLRAPDLTEMFGDRGGIVGNTELVPERGLQGDVGARVTPDDDVQIDAAIFASQVTDLIVYIQNAQRTSFPVNLAQGRLAGGELSVTLALFGHLDSQTAATFTWSQNRQDDAALFGNALPGVPRWELWQATSVHAWRLRLGHTLSHIAGTWRDATNFYQSPPRVLHGAFVRGKPWQAGPEVELSVLNLLDRTWQIVDRNPLDAADDPGIAPIEDFFGYPLAGRTFLFTLRWRA